MDLISGMQRAAMLDKSLYEEVEHDPSAMQPAITVVAIASVASGIGSIGFSMGIFQMIIAVVLGTILSFVGWFIFAYIIFFLGTKFFAESQTEADHGQLLRTIGFANSPGLLRIFGIIPCLGWVISLAASIWVLVATVIAVKQALDYTEMWRAVVVCLIGWVIYFLLMLIPTIIFGTTMMASQMQ